FVPPNVKGWDGGLSWITTNNLLARYNEAAVLVQGDISTVRAELAQANAGKQAGGGFKLRNQLRDLRLTKVDVEKILTEKERSDKSKLVAALEKRLLQAKLSPKQEQTLRDYLAGQDALDDAAILNTIRLMMSTPEYQLT
ncbi:MAG TPA: DUF1800 family protein, partial [Verrucomicrobiae bacterium]|nr:DUF1800 family protein [Verrucomicrobiae bacterium]